MYGIRIVIEFFFFDETPYLHRLVDLVHAAFYCLIEKESLKYIFILYAFDIVNVCFIFLAKTYKVRLQLRVCLHDAHTNPAKIG
jgi:hypothetical protein